MLNRRAVLNDITLLCKKSVSVTLHYFNINQQPVEKNACLCAVALDEIQYLTYINDFKRDVTPNFIQWINGSFVSRKENPKDIDFLTIIDFQIYEAKAKLIDNQFRNPIAKAKYILDAYTLKSYPLGHKNHYITECDLLYWENWFGRTKMNRAKKKFSKGFIQIQFQI